MFEYTIRRIFLMIPTLFIITVLSFSISRLAPGDPAELKAYLQAVIDEWPEEFPEEIA